jgi:hypothetical protein
VADRAAVAVACAGGLASAGALQPVAGPAAHAEGERAELVLTSPCDQIAAVPWRSRRQAEQRRRGHELRRRAVAFRREQCDLGWSPCDVAAALTLPSRTLAHWCRHLAFDGFEIALRGRPPRSTTPARHADVTDFLATHGPAISVATLKAEFSDVVRRELEVLHSEFRKACRAEHAPTRCDLTWLVPGSVWAMDFSHSPHRIDGCFPAILNVRDLASHQQLLWLPVLREDAATSSLFDSGATVVGERRWGGGHQIRRLKRRPTRKGKNQAAGNRQFAFHRSITLCRDQRGNVRSAERVVAEAIEAMITPPFRSIDAAFPLPVKTKVSEPLPLS